MGFFQFHINFKLLLSCFHVNDFAHSKSTFLYTIQLFVQSLVQNSMEVMKLLTYWTMLFLLKIIFIVWSLQYMSNVFCALKIMWYWSFSVILCYWIIAIRDDCVNAMTGTSLPRSKRLRMIFRNDAEVLGSVFWANLRFPSSLIFNNWYLYWS
mgnify:CR=1 FL=1